MDEGYEKAINEAFFHYYKKGWIYQGKRIVNWCPRCATSLSDLELEYTEEIGKLWHIKYPIEGGGFITIATTRPETMIGDSAVAVNLKDERYKNIIGKTAILPLVGREIPIIGDRRIDQNFGTGAVKITPAHDMLDAEIGKTRNLPIFKVIGENGKMRKEAGEYEGLTILEARTKIVEDLEKQNLIEKIEEYSQDRKSVV